MLIEIFSVCYGILFLIIISTMIWAIFREGKKKTVNPMIIQSEFNKDIEFLHFLIQTRVDNQKVEFELSKVEEISEESFNMLIKQHTLDTYKSLSSEYIILLNRYFNSSALIDYISQRFKNEIMVMCMERYRDAIIQDTHKYRKK